MYIFISHCPLTYYPVFENIDFEGEKLEKEKKIVENFENFEEFSKFSKSEISVL